MISNEYKGIKYAITNEAINDLLQFHGIDAIKEIERGIDLELKSLASNVTITDGVAKLTVTLKS